MRTISVDQLARVEGNGGIHATIDGSVVSDVKFTINEGPRLIEKLVLGRTPEEDVSMSPRICAICTCSHKNAVLRAMENALDVTITPKSYLLRELMHMGEFIESHSLHTFYLALPDYLGFPNAIAMASKFEFEVKIALEMKHFGNHIMKLTNGRYIHGENAVIGGFGAYPSRKDLIFLKERAIHFMPFVYKTVDIFCNLPYPDGPVSDTVYACCEPGGGRFGFWGDSILVSDGTLIPRDEYKKLTNEFVVPHSFAKHSRYKGKPYSVGALARIVNLGERLEGEAGLMYKKHYNSRWASNPFFHNASRSLEIMYAFERIPDLVDEFLKLKDPSSMVEYETREGKGTGLVEAPRGLLIHHHEIEDGKVSDCDIITPTAQLTEDIERYGLIAAQNLLDGGTDDDGIRDRLDILVRAFDPCISCSAHMAQVSTAPPDDWKRRLADILAGAEPLFIGIGNPDLGDDGAGIAMARELRSRGAGGVLLEPELEEDEGLWAKDARPLIFLDAIDFREPPGKTTLLPMGLVLNSLSLTHRILPSIKGLLRPEQLRNAYILGIQPESLEEGAGISAPVRSAMDLVLDEILP